MRSSFVTCYAAVVTSLVLASAVFVLIHLLISGTGLRDRLLTVMGEGPYRGLYSLASLVAIIWMSRAYGDVTVGNTMLWVPQAWWSHVAAVVLLPAFYFVVAGLSTPSPTLVDGERVLREGGPVQGILRITRHPMLVGMFVWALAHIACNGDLASAVFFGAFAVVSGFGTVSIDRKRRRKLGQAWDPFEGSTSILPFAAILAGRSRFVASELGMVRPVVAAIAFLAFYVAHPWLFGVPAGPL